MNFFEHWEADVLSGKITYSYTAMLNTLHFKPGPDGSFQEKLNDWAQRNNVLLRPDTVIEHGKTVSVVHFSPLPSTKS